MLRPFILSFVTTYLSTEPTMFGEGAILVNRDGRRFTDERDKTNFAFGNQHGKQAFIVIDDEVAKKIRKWRTEEHTSELQTLIRITIDIWCFKRKKEKK